MSNDRLFPHNSNRPDEVPEQKSGQTQLVTLDEVLSQWYSERFVATIDNVQIEQVRENATDIFGVRPISEYFIKLQTRIRSRRD